MPIFEYSCRACAHQFEALVRKETVVACPNCTSNDLERLFSLPAVQSSGTKQQALNAAKKRDAKLGAERVHAQREYEAHHDD